MRLLRSACASTPPTPSEISMKKLEVKGETSFDTQFIIQSHAESEENHGSPLGSTSLSSTANLAIIE